MQNPNVLVSRFPKIASVFGLFIFLGLLAVFTILAVSPLAVIRFNKDPCSASVRISAVNLAEMHYTSHTSDESRRFGDNK